MTYHNRHECKFVVPEPVAARLLKQVAPFLQPDPFAATSTDHAYPIASLYLDDANDTLYRETLEGRAYRYKLRVRSYTDDPTAPVFLEVKRRHDRVVQKLRCPIPRTSLASVLTGKVASLPGLSPLKRQSFQEFMRLVQFCRAVPRCTVLYDRQAYIGRHEDEVRVTFDRRLYAMEEREPIVRVRDGRYAPVRSGGVVLELKFTDRCPPWMLDAVRACELRRSSFSKYCIAIDALVDARRVQAN